MCEIPQCLRAKSKIVFYNLSSASVINKYRDISTIESNHTNRFRCPAVIMSSVFSELGYCSNIQKDNAENSSSNQN